MVMADGAIFEVMCCCYKDSYETQFRYAKTMANEAGWEGARRDAIEPLPCPWPGCRFEAKAGWWVMIAGQLVGVAGFGRNKHEFERAVALAFVLASYVYTDAVLAISDIDAELDSLARSMREDTEQRGVIRGMRIGRRWHEY